MELFRKVKMEGAYWGVFLVNPNDINDRYLVTSTFAKESDAEHFTVFESQRKRPRLLHQIQLQLRM
jgi:hypothetical protein